MEPKSNEKKFLVFKIMYLKRYQEILTIPNTIPVIGSQYVTKQALDLRYH